MMPDPNVAPSTAAQRMEKISGMVKPLRLLILRADGYESNGTQLMKGDLVVEQGNQVQSYPVTINAKVKITSLNH